MHLAYIWIVCHLSAKNYQNRWKFDAVLTKTNLLSFFETRCKHILNAFYSSLAHCFENLQYTLGPIKQRNVLQLRKKRVFIELPAIGIFT